MGLADRVNADDAARRELAKQAAERERHRLAEKKKVPALLREFVEVITARGVAPQPLPAYRKNDLLLMNPVPSSVMGWQIVVVQSKESLEGRWIGPLGVGVDARLYELRTNVSLFGNKDPICFADDQLPASLVFDPGRDNQRWQSIEDLLYFVLSAS